jgi:hypothetical protein
MCAHTVVANGEVNSTYGTVARMACMLCPNQKPDYVNDDDDDDAADDVNKSG